MASADLKALATKIGEKLKELGGDVGREELIRQHGQLLVINKRRFEGILKELLPQLKKSGDTEVEGRRKRALAQIWRDWTAYLSSLEGKIKDIKEGNEVLITAQERKTQLYAAKKKLTLSKLDHVFLITSYRTIKGAKGGQGELGRIITAALSAHKMSKKGLKKAKERLGGAAIDGTYAGGVLGHEEGGRGVASTGMKALKMEAIAAGTTGLSQSDKDKLDSIFTKIKNTITVSIDHSQAFDSNGKFKKTYIPILTWQHSATNQEYADAEKEATRILEKEFEKLETLKGSISLLDGLSQVLFHAASPKKKRKNVKTQGVKKKSVRSKGTGKVKAKYERPIPVTLIKSAGIEQKSVKRIKSSEKERLSPFAIAAMLNKKLPENVRNNMGEPRLVNQTGRFANSVQIQDVNITRQGYTSFGYTYEKDPYQVFEVGTGPAPWATTQRDPRRLIDRSIRDVAAELALGRFYTRRL